jgi:hypothetical protein
MSPHQALSVAVRLFVIWLVIYVVRTAPTFVLQAKRYDDEAALFLGIGVLIVILLVLLAMWFFSRTLARIMLPGEGKPASSPLSPDQWFEVGCSLIGLWVLTNAVPGLIRYLIMVYLDKRDPATIPLGADWHASAIYYLVELGLGLWLLVGGRGMQQLIRRVRRAGPG